METIQNGTQFYEYYPDLLEDIPNKPSEALKVLNEAVRRFRKMNRNDLLAEAYFHIAECHFRLGNAKLVTSNAIQAISYARQSTNMEMLLPRCYNIAGIGYSSCGEYNISQQYYLEARKFALAVKDKRTIISIENNIGSLFLQLGDYKEAIKYLESVYKAATARRFSAEFATLSESDKRDRKEMYYVAVINMADITYHEGEYEKAIRYLDQLEDALEGDYVFMYVNNIATIRIKTCLAMDDMAGAKEVLNELFVRLRKEGIEGEVGETTELFEDYTEIFKILIAQEEEEFSWSLLEVMRQICEELENVSRWTAYYGYLAQYYMLTGDKDSYYNACAQYHNYGIENDVENHKSMLQGIKNQMEIEKAVQLQKAQEEQAEEMRLLSETDELTKLLNRRSFNRLSQKYYSAAYEDMTCFGLIMMDIDFFKQYNDHYGHLAGDDCLKKIASILQSCEKEGFLCSRYGGDEFVIIVRNHTDAETVAFMEDVISKVKEMKLEHVKSPITDYVTITMGAFNTKPNENHTVMDILQSADDTLYEAKRQGKNRALLGK